MRDELKTKTRMHLDAATSITNLKQEIATLHDRQAAKEEEVCKSVMVSDTSVSAAVLDESPL